MLFDGELTNQIASSFCVTVHYIVILNVSCNQMLIGYDDAHGNIVSEAL